MEDITTYIVNLASHIPSIQRFIFMFCALSGYYFVGHGLYIQFSAGRNGQGVSSPITSVILILVGIFVSSLQAFAEFSSVTFFGASADPIIIDSYTRTDGDNARVVLQAITAFVSLIGWCTVAKGLFKWREGAIYNNQPYFSSVIIFIVSGVFAINFDAFIDILAVSAGASPIGTKYFNF